MKYLNHMNMGDYSISPVQCFHESKQNFQERVKLLFMTDDWKKAVEGLIYQSVIMRNNEFRNMKKDLPYGCERGYEIKEILICSTAKGCPYCLVKIKPLSAFPFLAVLYFDGKQFRFYIPKKGNMIYIPKNSLINETLSFPISFEFSDSSNKTIRGISFFDMDELQTLCNYANTKLNYITITEEMESVLM